MKNDTEAIAKRFAQYVRTRAVDAMAKAFDEDKAYASAATADLDAEWEHFKRDVKLEEVMSTGRELREALPPEVCDGIRGFWLVHRAGVQLEATRPWYEIWDAITLLNEKRQELADRGMSFLHGYAGLASENWDSEE